MLKKKALTQQKSWAFYYVDMRQLLFDNHATTVLAVQERMEKT